MAVTAATGMGMATELQWGGSRVANANALNTLATRVAHKSGWQLAGSSVALVW